MAEQGLTVGGDRAPVQSNPALVYLASLAPVGRRSMASALARVARLLGYDDVAHTPWASLRYEHVQAIRTKLTEDGYRPATVNQTLAGIRGTLRAAWQMGQLDSDTYQRAMAVQTVTGSTLPAGRAVAPGELVAIMREVGSDPTPAGRRDAALIALAYGAGLRRAELAGLTLADLADDGELITVRVMGKRAKERLTYLDNGSAQAMRDWLHVRGEQPGPVFWRGRKGGHLTPGHGMTPQAVRDVIARRAARAGVPNLTPHDLRRSFVSDLLDAGQDIATVAAMAGHSSVTTTQRYDRRGERAKQRAARALSVPYYGR